MVLRLQEREDAEGVLAYVAQETGAIGYVPWQQLPAALPAGARVLRLRVDGRDLAPSDPGYPLRIPAPSQP